MLAAPARSRRHVRALGRPLGVPARVRGRGAGVVLAFRRGTVPASGLSYDRVGAPAYGGGGGPGAAEPAPRAPGRPGRRRGGRGGVPGTRARGGPVVGLRVGDLNAAPAPRSGGAAAAPRCGPSVTPAARPCRGRPGPRRGPTSPASSGARRAWPPSRPAPRGVGRPAPEPRALVADGVEQPPQAEPLLVGEVPDHQVLVPGAGRGAGEPGVDPVEETGPPCRRGVAQPAVDVG